MPFFYLRSVDVIHPGQPGPAGRDDAGRWVANGTYLYHLRAGNLTQTRKLVVAR